MGGVMSSVTISGDTSGSIILQAPSVAGSTTLTLPTTSGTVLTSANAFSAGTGPAFSAYRGGASQSASSGVTTKVALNSEEFDTANCFDSTTNYRFTPTVAGYYQVNGGIGMSAGAISLAIVQIWKNGSEFKRGNDLRSSLGTDCLPVISTLIYMNGTTDYLELYGYISGTGTCLFNNVQSSTYFQASLVRAA